MGRGTTLGSFVKQGYNDGFIEIELKGRKGESNITIQRQLNKKDMRTLKFTLNGENVSGKKITDCVEGLGIQVNNLCSFLPQDKVAEFAQMTPQTLLKATEQAAGNKNLLEWHNVLIEEGKKLKSINGVWRSFSVVKFTLTSKQEIVTLRSNLETQEHRNAALERDVQAYLERKDIERQISLLELILPFKEYLESREEYNRLKEEREKMHQKVLALQERNKPVREFKE